MSFVKVLSVSTFIIVPFISLAHGQVIDEHPNMEEDVVQISPVVLIAGLILVVGVGGAVWFFMKKGAIKSKPTAQTSAEAPQNTDIK